MTIVSRIVTGPRTENYRLNSRIRTVLCLAPIALGITLCGKRPCAEKDIVQKKTFSPCTPGFGSVRTRAGPATEATTPIFPPKT